MHCESVGVRSVENSRFLSGGKFCSESFKRQVDVTKGYHRWDSGEGWDSSRVDRRAG